MLVYYRITRGPSVYWFSFSGSFSDTYDDDQIKNQNQSDCDWAEGLPSYFLNSYFSERKFQENDQFTVSVMEGKEVTFVITKIELDENIDVRFTYDLK